MKNAIILILFFCCLPMNAQNKEILVKSDVNEVTVFINGAQIIRKKTIDVPEGNSIIRFVGMSPYMDSKSIIAKVSGEVMVLSVNHQFNYIDSAKQSNELATLNDKLKVLQDKLTVEAANSEVISEELTFLIENRNIGGKNQELNLTNLKETANYYRERISALKMKQIEINRNIENYNKEKSAIEKQIKQITVNKPSPMSEVLINVNAKMASKCDVTLSYYVKNAGWFPSYDIRANSIDDPITLTYKANIHQNTKEEWRNVKLKLSSSNPNLGSIAPQLQTYYLNYNTMPPRYTNLSGQVSGRITDATTNEPLPGALITVKGTSISTVSDMNGNYSISLPNSSSELEFSFVGYSPVQIRPRDAVINVRLSPDIVQLDEIVVAGYGGQKKTDAKSSIRIKGTASINESSLSIPVSQSENQTAFEFEIKTPYTVSSDNKVIAVDIENYLLDAQYEYHCVPKIDKDAFLTASITNWEKYNLLEGEANIFFENTFVGKSILDTRSISDTLRLSLGRDKNLIVKREKIKDYTTRQFLGNKKEEARSYAISVKNNKRQAVNIRLYDQVPVSTSEEIEVSVENISGGAFNKATGEVLWNIRLEPSAKKDLELKYKVKYPKERVLIIE